MAEVTTWGELDPSWTGRQVIVRWEDAGDTGPDSLSGMPHEHRGEVVIDEWLGGPCLYEGGTEGYTNGFPAHALVQEAQQ